MQILDELKQSRHWSPKFNLPVGYGIENNPWLDLAIAEKILKQNNCALNQTDIVAWILSCRTNDRFPLYNRYPDGTGGLMSQDELIGACTISNAIARHIVDTLEHNLLCYPNDKSVPMWRSFKGRFPWFIVYVLSLVGCDLSWFSQFLWCLNVWFSAGVTSGSTPHILIWLMEDEMIQYPMCRKAIQYWREKRSKNNMPMSKVMKMYFNQPGDEWYSKWVGM